MQDLTRRNFIKLLGATGVVSVVGAMRFPTRAHARNAGKAIVVGGGFSGATCANYIRRYDPGVQVTLIEPRTKYVTCPFSNTVLVGLNEMDSITHGYDGLRERHGIDVIHESVTAIDPQQKKVTLKGGRTLSCDRLVVAPGIAFRWERIEGYSEAASEAFPHAWQAGAQTLLLREQLRGMKDGGVVIISIPPKPFRAPPAPYERASLIAHFFMENKPKSKVLILDAGERSPELSLFEKHWKQLYPGKIEWVGGQQGGHIVRIDTQAKKLFAQSGQSYTGDVINLIPPQQAGVIAVATGLTNADGWCSVDQRTFECIEHPGIHVIGDACEAGDMHKIAHAACSQAQICAAATVSAFRGEAMPEPIYNDSIYSFIGPKQAISATTVYRLSKGQIRAVQSGLSPENAPTRFRAKEATYALGWYEAITSEAFAL